MALFYRSERIGKNGKPFTLWKIRTLKEGIDKMSSFVQENQYTPLGRFLRKTKIDELPQIICLLRGQINIVGPRAEEARSISVLPEDIRERLLSVKPGLTSLASVGFFNEEEILKKVSDPAALYWKEIKPMKIALDLFYIENKCLILDLAIIYMTVKRVILSFFHV